MESGVFAVRKVTLVEMKTFLVKWKKEWTACILVVLIMRVFYACIGIWVLSSGGPIPLNEPVYNVVKPYLQFDLFSKYLVNPWFGWDTISYLKIAIMGYQNDATVAFMPLYPLLIRLFAYFFGGNYLLAALAISTLCASVTLILMYELFQQLYSEEIAWRTVLIFMSFPTAFFLLAGYTESLFMTFVLAFWFLTQKQQWWWAGLCAGLATLTRLQGVVLSAVMLWMLLRSVLGQPVFSSSGLPHQTFNLLKSFRQRAIHSGSKTAWLAVPIPIAVATSYQVWLNASGYGTIGDALRKYWLIETVPPWMGFALFLQRLPATHFRYMDWIDLALLVIVLIAAVIGLRRLDSAFSIYVWLTLAVLWMRGTPPHLLASYSRYFLALFPLFVLAALNPNRYKRLAIIVVFFFLQILLVSIFLWGSWVA